MVASARYIWELLRVIDDSSLLLVTRGGLFTMAERRVDIISELKKKSFGQKSEEERWNIINEGRPKVSVSLLRTDGCGKTRSFSKVWYGKADWLCGSSERQALFCWPCTLLSTKSVSHKVIQGLTSLLIYLCTSQNLWESGLGLRYSENHEPPLMHTCRFPY